jgi:uncharacterized protein (TIGR02118 family)
MIVVTVMYPNGPDKHFDMDYYINTHIALVKEQVGPALKQVTVDKGLSAGAPGSMAGYAAIARLLFDSLEDQVTYMAPHSADLNADIPNFTNISPSFQMSEVII